MRTLFLVLCFYLFINPAKTQSDIISIEQVTGGTESFIPFYLIKENKDTNEIMAMFKDTIIPYFGLHKLNSFTELDELLLNNQKDSVLIMNEKSNETWGGFQITGKNKSGKINYRFFICCSDRTIEYFVKLKNQALEMNKQDIVELLDTCILFLYEQKRY